MQFEVNFVAEYQLESILHLIFMLVGSKCSVHFKMKLFQHVIMLNVFCSCCGDLVADYLINTYIKNVVFINCNNQMDKIFILKSQSRKGILSSMQSGIKKTHYNLNKQFRIAVVVDTTCSNWATVFNEESSNLIFRSTTYWLFLATDYTVISNLSCIPFDIDSEVIVAIEKHNYSELFEVYNSGLHNHGSFNASKIGKWDSTGLELNKQFKYLRRANMSGVILKLMMVVTKKLKGETFFKYSSTPELTHIDSFNRYNFALLLHLQEIYGFDYNTMRTNSWGYSVNGSFDGMVGALQRKEVDVGGASIFFRHERAKIVDYTVETWTARPCFIFRHPKVSGAFYTLYTKPLDAVVWYCILTLLLLVSVILHKLLKRNSNRGPDEQLESSWSLVMLAMVSAVAQQGMVLKTSSTAIQLTVFMTFIFALTMYQFFSASIVSTLLKDGPRSIKTLSDLLHSPLKVGIEDLPYNLDYFRRTTDPVAIEMYKKKIVSADSKNFLPPSAGLALVKQGGYAFHVDVAGGYKIIRETFTDHEICDLVEVQLFPPQRTVAIVQKGSPFRELVTYGLRKMAETGITNRLRKVWHEPKPKCMNLPDTTTFSVSLYEFSLVLCILAIGTVLAVAILFLEIMTARFQRSKGHNSSRRASFRL